MPVGEHGSLPRTGCAGEIRLRITVCGRGLPHPSEVSLVCRAQRLDSDVRDVDWPACAGRAGPQDAALPGPTKARHPLGQRRSRCSKTLVFKAVCYTNKPHEWDQHCGTVGKAAGCSASVPYRCLFHVLSSWPPPKWSSALTGCKGTQSRDSSEALWSTRL